MVENLLPSRCDDHASAVAVEQGGAEFFLEESNLSAQRRLSDVESIRGFAQASQFGNVNQSFQLTDVHVPHPSG